METLSASPSSSSAVMEKLLNEKASVSVWSLVLATGSSLNQSLLFWTPALGYSLFPNIAQSPLDSTKRGHFHAVV